MVCPFNGILFNNEKGGGTEPCYNISVRGQIRACVLSELEGIHDGLVLEKEAGATNVGSWELCLG